MLEALNLHTAPRLRVECRPLDTDTVLDRDVLAAIAFGEPPKGKFDPRCIHVPLSPLVGHGLAQVWTGTGPVKSGRSGIIHHAEDGTHLMGWLEVDEAECDGIANAAEAAYRQILKFHGNSRYRHIWRLWNFVAAINAGVGDDERYKQFCLGRARAFASATKAPKCLGFPAATAVGTFGERRRLQVCWLAGAAPGRPIENPRQVSAFHYPRQYGPVPPSFSRAMLTPHGSLLTSGTASIVGHGSVHHGDVAAQLEETLRNLDAIAATAASRGHATADRSPLLTAFLRHPDDAAAVATRLREHYPAHAGVVVLGAAICRSDLLLEIEAID